jgi:hypothetical protein
MKQVAPNVSLVLADKRLTMEIDKPLSYEQVDDLLNNGLKIGFQAYTKSYGVLGILLLLAPFFYFCAWVEVSGLICGG